MLTLSQAPTTQKPPMTHTLPTWNLPAPLLGVIDDVLFAVLKPAFCDVCKAGGVHTFGLTYLDTSTQTRFCLDCLETACADTERNCPA